MTENRAIDEGRVWQEFCHVFLRVNGEDAMFSYGLAVPQTANASSTCGPEIPCNAMGHHDHPGVRC